MLVRFAICLYLIDFLLKFDRHNSNYMRVCVCVKYSQTSRNKRTNEGFQLLGIYSFSIFLSFTIYFCVFFFLFFRFSSHLSHSFSSYSIVYIIPPMCCMCAPQRITNSTGKRRNGNLPTLRIRLSPFGIRHPVIHIRACITAKHTQIYIYINTELSLTNNCNKSMLENTISNNKQKQQQ